MEAYPKQKLPFNSSINLGSISDPVSLLITRAREHGSDLLLESSTMSATYEDVSRISRGIANRLKLEGVQPGQLVALQLPLTLHFPFMLATFYLGAITCAYTESDFRLAGISPDWLLTLQDSKSAIAKRTINVGGVFIADASAYEGWFPPLPYPSSSPCILFLSSGTTGNPKPSRLSVANLMGRSFQIARLMFTQPYMSLLDVSAYVGLTTFIGQMLLGETYIIPGKSRENLESINRRSVRYLQGSVAQLSGLVAEIHSNSVSVPSSIEAVQVVGSHMPSSLRDEIIDLLKCEVHARYGTTEGGLVSYRMHNSLEPFDAGFVIEDVEVEVLREDGNQAEFGEQGIIRYRGSFSLLDQIDVTKGSDTSEDPNWFYPGDRGVLSNSGHLLVTGRDGDVINLGGLKLNLTTVDNYLSSLNSIIEAASFVLIDSSGLVQLGIAIVGQNVDVIDLEKKLRIHFNQAIRPVFFEVDSVPRTTMGKPIRKVLAKKFSEK